MTKENNDDVLKLIKDWETKQQKVKRNSWDEHHILEAYQQSTRSLDAQTQCGCVIVKSDNSPISNGYNSFIGGINDSVLPNLRSEKYDFMLHAEHNAVLNCAKNGISCREGIVYVTGIPCINCFQYLHQAGISEVKYHAANHIHMCADKKQRLILSVLLNLSNMKLTELIFDNKFSEKINKIKSCR